MTFEKLVQHSALLNLTCMALFTFVLWNYADAQFTERWLFSSLLACLISYIAGRFLRPDDEKEMGSIAVSSYSATRIAGLFLLSLPAVLTIGAITGVQIGLYEIADTAWVLPALACTAGGQLARY